MAVQAYVPMKRDSRPFLTRSTRSSKTPRWNQWRSSRQWTRKESNSCRWESSSTKTCRVRSRKGKLSNSFAPPYSKRIMTCTCSTRPCLMKKESSVPIWQRISRSAWPRSLKRSMSWGTREQKRSNETKRSDRRSRVRWRHIASMKSITRNKWALIRRRWARLSRSSRVNLKSVSVASSNKLSKRKLSLIRLNLMSLSSAIKSRSSCRSSRRLKMTYRSQVSNSQTSRWTQTREKLR